MHENARSLLERGGTPLESPSANGGEKRRPGRRTLLNSTLVRVSKAARKVEVPINIRPLHDIRVDLHLT